MIASIGIPSANTRSVEDAASPVPSMGDTVRGYFRPLVLVKVRKDVKDMQVTEAREEFRGMGCIQPFGPRELKMKPEGQRSWNWQMLHCTPEVRLRNDEEFLLGNTRYRVMSQLDYSDYGYLAYELVQDYNGT